MEAVAKVILGFRSFIWVPTLALCWWLWMPAFYIHLALLLFALIVVIIILQKSANKVGWPQTHMLLNAEIQRIKNELNRK